MPVQATSSVAGAYSSERTSLPVLTWAGNLEGQAAGGSGGRAFESSAVLIGGMRSGRERCEPPSPGLYGQRAPLGVGGRLSP